jgi:hypothetical protein
MRFFLVTGIAAALGGCAFLDNIDFGPAALDPSRIYLQHETVTVYRRRDIENYACLRGVLLCSQRGGGWECFCT